MKTHICIVMDRSGSMEKVKEETCSGFNQFIKDQQRELKLNKYNDARESIYHGRKNRICDCGKCINEITLTLIQFDDEIKVSFSNLPIEEITGIEYKPRGMTRLFDAINAGIEQTERDIQNRIVDKVLFVIMTDGEDNSSSIKLREIAKFIRNCENEYKWQFVFIGTNMDTFTESPSINIPIGWTYSTTYINVPDMWKDFSRGVICYLASTDKQVNKFFDQ